MTKFKLKLGILTGLFLFSISVFSQTVNDSTAIEQAETALEKAPKKLNFGCGFGLNFIGGTSINVLPNLTYKLSDKINFGAGLQGNYSSIKNVQTTITYGANAFGLFNPTKRIMTSLDFTELKVSTKNETDNINNSYWDSALFVGVGVYITNKISVGAKYNLLYKEGKSIYTSPLIPFVNIGF